MSKQFEILFAKDQPDEAALLERLATLPLPFPVTADGDTVIGSIVDRKESETALMLVIQVTENLSPFEFLGRIDVVNWAAVSGENA